MGKGRRKEQRKARAAERPNRAMRRAVLAEAKLQARETMDRIADRETPVEEAAALVIEHASSTTMAKWLHMRVGPEQANVIARAALDAKPDDFSVLMLASDVALFSGDLARADELGTAALALSPNGDTTIRHVAGIRVDRGRFASALELVQPLCRANPLDEEALDLQQEAYEGIDNATCLATDPCPCESGKTYESCCADPDAAAIERFETAAFEDPVFDALADYWMQPRFAGIRAQACEDWYGAADADQWPAAQTPNMPLLMEHAWRTHSVRSPGIDDDEDCILGEFIRDPETPPDLAARARQRFDAMHWGLWQIANPSSCPGVALVDLLTSTKIYAACSEPGLRRWSVLLGPVFPDRGFWRTGFCVELSPQEAEALVPCIYEMVNLTTAALARERGKRKPPPELGYDPMHPLTITADLEDEPSPVADFFSAIIGAGFADLIDQIEEWRSRPLSIANTDGDPLEFINARIRITNPQAVRAQLVVREDFRAHRDGELEWLGRALTPGEAAGSRAEVRARFGPGVGNDEEESRYTRARFSIDDDVISVEINSRATGTAARRLARRGWQSTRRGRDAVRSRYGLARAVGSAPERRRPRPVTGIGGCVGTSLDP
ncbi:MAG: SEC-C metal-binding domain-containing protein [Actinomycetota bacterium]